MFHIDISCNIVPQFDQIAKDLFSNYILVVNKETYRFSEIEFYHNSPKHPDPFVHKDKQQKERGQWYFHGSGIDLTIGDGTNYGGILIRGIKRISDKKYFSGPLNVAKEIFSQFGKFELQSIQLGLQKSTDSRELGDDFVAAPRVGLSEKKDKDYYDKPYRFITFIEPKHPFKEKTKVAEEFKHKVGPLWTEALMIELFGYKII